MARIMGEFTRAVSSSVLGNLLLRISSSGFITLCRLGATLIATTPTDGPIQFEEITARAG